MAFTNILVPTDGSEYTKAAVKKAMELAKLAGGKITALYVLDQTILTNMPMDTAVMNVYNTLEKEGKAAVDYVRDLGAEEGVPVELSIREGTPVKVSSTSPPSTTSSSWAPWEGPGCRSSSWEASQRGSSEHPNAP